MLSTQYRLRLEFICKCIANGEEVKLDDMVWAQKLAKANTTANEMLRKARRQGAQDIEEGSLDGANEGPLLGSNDGTRVGNDVGTVDGALLGFDD